MPRTVQLCGLSWDRFNVLGDRNSVEEVEIALEEAKKVAELRDQVMRLEVRLAAKETK